MRPVLFALAVGLLTAGCVAEEAPLEPANVDSDPLAPVDDAALTGAVLLGEMAFVLGPADATPVAQMRTTLDVEVPPDVISVVVTLAHHNSVSYAFHLDGIAGCEIGFNGIQIAEGDPFTRECHPAAGMYTLAIYQSAGYFQGTVRVIANYD